MDYAEKYLQACSQTFGVDDHLLGAIENTAAFEVVDHHKKISSFMPLTPSRGRVAAWSCCPAFPLSRFPAVPLSFPAFPLSRFPDGVSCPGECPGHDSRLVISEKSSVVTLSAPVLPLEVSRQNGTGVLYLFITKKLAAARSASAAERKGETNPTSTVSWSHLCDFVAILVIIVSYHFSNTHFYIDLLDNSIAATLSASKTT